MLVDAGTVAIPKSRSFSNKRSCFSAYRTPNSLYPAAVKCKSSSAAGQPEEGITYEVGITCGRVLIISFMLAHLPF